MPVPHRSARPTLLATAFVLSCGLASCAGDSNPVRDLAVVAGVTGGEPKAAPDFVSRSRPAGTEYVPVGTDAPKRDSKAKTATEVSIAEAELDAARAVNAAKAAAARSAATPAR